jgi:hypothetical protein
MFIIKQGTATTFMMGPFVDETDGFTFETGLAAAMNHASTGILISINGADFAARSTLTLPVYKSYGFYLVSLDGTDTGTIGKLVVAYKDATCRVVSQELQVVGENVFNSLFGAATVKLKVDLTQILEHTMTNTGTQIADAFQTMFDVASPVLTAASINQTGDTYLLAKSGGAGDITALTTNLAKVPKSDGAVAFNAAVQTAISVDVKTTLEADAALLNTIFNRLCGVKIEVDRANETITMYNDAGDTEKYIFTRTTAGDIDIYTRTTP